MRTREGIEMGQRVNTVVVMVKFLAEPDVETYLAAVPRDRPQAVSGG